MPIVRMMKLMLMMMKLIMTDNCHTQQGFVSCLYSPQLMILMMIIIKLINDDDNDDDDDDKDDDDDDDDDVSYSERFCILLQPPHVRSTTPVNSRCSSFWGTSS